MKYTSKKQVIKAAQEMGSKATTFEGAAKYILSNTGSVLQPFSFNGWKRDAEAADKYKKEKRKNRICLKYAGMLRLPGYLTEEDKQIINNHPASVEYRKLLSLPDFVRAFYISHIVDIPRLNGFVRKCRKAKGRFINIPAIARHAFETCDFGRTRRNHIGENRIYPGIRTTSYERGRNPWGGKWTHNDYYADYTLIAPDTTKNIYSLYYVDSNGKEHKVLKSHNFVKIDNSGPNKIAKETTSRTNLPLHIQRRMLDFYLPSVLRVEYDANQKAKCLMIVDSLGEQYHIYPVYNLDGAKTQVKDAVRAIKKRRAEVISFNNPENIWVQVEDSYNAGNCRPATDSFAKEYLDKIGAGGDVCTRADLLLSIRNDAYTKRAVVQAAHNFIN